MVSRVTELLRAFSTAAARRALRSGSAPPSLAATMISRTSLTTIWPRFCALASRPACFHCAPTLSHLQWLLILCPRQFLFEIHNLLHLGEEPAVNAGQLKKLLQSE